MGTYPMTEDDRFECAWCRKHVVGWNIYTFGLATSGGYHERVCGTCCKAATDLVMQYRSTQQSFGKKVQQSFGKRRCEYCGKLTRETTAGCDHCDIEDK